MPIETAVSVINRQKVEISLSNQQRLITYSGEVAYSHRGVNDSTDERIKIAFDVDDQLPEDASIVSQAPHVALADLHNLGAAINARWSVTGVAGELEKGRYRVVCTSGVQDADGYIYRLAYTVTAVLRSAGWEVRIEAPIAQDPVLPRFVSPA